MLDLDPQSLDSTRVHPIVLNDSDTQPLVGVFTGAETFGAKLWTGNNQTPLIDLSRGVAWADPTNAVVNLTITTADIAALAPGFYRIHILLNPGTDDTLAADCSIQLTPAPGTATAPPVYTDAAELQKYAPWITELESLDTDQTGFAQARGRARTTINETVMARYRWVLQDQARRHRAVLWVTPIYPTTGYDAGPGWGPSSIPDTTLQTDEITMQGYLDSGYLMLDDRLKEVAARLAISFVCASQIGPAPEGQTGWQELARRFRAEARMLLLGVRFRVDTDQDGVPNFEIL